MKVRPRRLILDQKSRRGSVCTEKSGAGEMQGNKTAEVKL